MKHFILTVLLTIVLTSCTAEQAYMTASEVGEAGKAYVKEKIVVRQQYRARQRDIVDATYNAEMRAADLAERNGDIISAKAHWEEAWMILEEHMPMLKSVREKIRDFFGSDSVDLGEALPSE